MAQRKEHHLALQLCAFLSLPPAKVLTHWACLKLRSSKSRDLSDAALEHAIVAKVHAHCPSGMSFAPIALAAFDGGRGRVRLATVLLDYEKSATDKVRCVWPRTSQARLGEVLPCSTCLCWGERGSRKSGERNLHSFFFRQAVQLVCMFVRF